MTTEAEFYAARRRENGYLYARRNAPYTTVMSRRTAKQGGKPVWLKDSKIIDMNNKTIWTKSK